ncbi:MAG: hypothetical protein R2692_05555 [Microbacterium sp.]
MTTLDGSWLTALIDGVVRPHGPHRRASSLAIALENLFPPLPSEVILPMAGARRRARRVVRAVRGAVLDHRRLGRQRPGRPLPGLGALLGLERLRTIARRTRCCASRQSTARSPGSRVTAARRCSSVGCCRSSQSHLDSGGVVRMPIWPGTRSC